MIILLYVSLTAALYIDNPKIINRLIGKYRINNPCELIRPNSEVVCEIRDRNFPNKNSNYMREDVISVLCYILRNVEYCSDLDNWMTAEYYASPEETMKKRSGDCEDFAILFCSVLRAMKLDAWVVSGREHAWVRIFLSDGSFLDLLGTAPPESLMFNEESIVYLNQQQLSQ